MRINCAFRENMIHSAIVFADEPTGNLDVETGNRVLELLVSGIRRYRQTLAMVTHDMDIAKQAQLTVKMEELKTHYTLGLHTV